MLVNDNKRSTLKTRMQTWSYTHGYPLCTKFEQDFQDFSCRCYIFRYKINKMSFKILPPTKSKQYIYSIFIQKYFCIKDSYKTNLFWRSSRCCKNKMVHYSWNCFIGLPTLTDIQNLRVQKILLMTSQTKWWRHQKLCRMIRLINV